MATGPGRNAPCPCGSGNKYKKCCLPKITSRPSPKAGDDLSPTAKPASMAYADDDLDDVSNRVVDLIDQGLLDDAEKQCHVLRDRYPDMIDWMERLAAVHEAREDWQKAAHHYRLAADQAENTPGHDRALIDDFRDTARRLESKLETPSP